MKYICVKECCHINFEDLTFKRIFIPGKIYEFEAAPDKNFFKRVPGQRNSKKVRNEMPLHLR